MHAEILSIGDELTTGQRLDTNSQWLSHQLGEIGIPVQLHTTVGDQLPLLVDAIRGAIRRCDVVLISGGLGPTADDLTREGIARAVEVPLVEDRAALDHIQAMFTRRGKVMPERNRVQALFPQGSRPIPNPEGTAPGIELEVPRHGTTPCRVIALPGVPAEMFQMWAQTVSPRLCAGRTKRVIRHRQIKVFGAGESHVESLLPDLIARGRSPSVGITVHQATITLRITADGETDDECFRAMEPTVQTIHQCLGNLVFGEEDDELQHAVVRQLRERGATLATAEIGTAGLVARCLGELTALSNVYRGSVLAFSPAALVSLLGVSPEAVNEYPLVSAQLAREMAVALRARSGADYALAVSGLPPHMPHAETPPDFYAAVAGPEGLESYTLDFSGHSAIIHSRAAKQVLNALRLKLLKAPKDPV